MASHVLVRDPVGEEVRIERRRGDHRQDLPGARVDEDAGPDFVTQAFEQRALQSQVERQLQRRPVTGVLEHPGVADLAPDAVHRDDHPSAATAQRVVVGPFDTALADDVASLPASSSFDAS